PILGTYPTRRSSDLQIEVADDRLHERHSGPIRQIEERHGTRRRRMGPDLERDDLNRGRWLPAHLQELPQLLTHGPGTADLTLQRSEEHTSALQSREN